MIFNFSEKYKKWKMKKYIPEPIEYPSLCEGEKLFLFARSGNLLQVKYLLRLNVEYDKDVLEKSLLVSCYGQFTGIVEELLKYGVKPDSPGNFKSCLIVSIENKDLAMVKLLLKYKADPNDRGAIFKAIDMGDISIIRELLDNGVDINPHASLPGSFPLQYSIKKGETDIAIYLLNQGAKYEGFIIRENNPLYIAFVKENYEIISELLYRGADRQDIFDIEENESNKEIRDFILNFSMDIKPAKRR